MVELSSPQISESVFEVESPLADEPRGSISIRLKPGKILNSKAPTTRQIILYFEQEIFLISFPAEAHRTVLSYWRDDMEKGVRPFAKDPKRLLRDSFSPEGQKLLQKAAGSYFSNPVDSFFFAKRLGDFLVNFLEELRDQEPILWDDLCHEYSGSLSF